MRRIPRIKFSQRHPSKPKGSSLATEEIPFFKSNVTSQPKAASSSGDARSYRFRSDVPASPSYTAVGGKASLLPKRTPISDKEIEAILPSKKFFGSWVAVFDDASCPFRSRVILRECYGCISKVHKWPHS
ncbi:hypothetical protein OPV22_027046 [Ensete ventricosum]|uniref:Uncharacterized protein n=1 Tax=Ensete ventricosum TaxID=4639 RepID=A0AAV8PZD2_ENSVE|nr:hypothetical protein OPV22_027046 [Ensete ventricosum]